MPIQPSSRMTPAEARRWWTTGLWTRLAMAGGLAVPAGLALAFEAGGAPEAGILVALAGALAAVAGWRGTARGIARQDGAPAARARRAAADAAPQRA